MNQAGNLAYDVFVNYPPPQDGLLPNGEPKRFSPMASTLIYGSENAVLTDPGMTEDQARALGDWVAGKGRNVTDIFITHGHGDHFFAAGLLAERFGARVVATARAIAQMQGSVAARPLLWDKLYPGLIPPSPVTAVTVPDNRFTLEGRDLVMVDVGHGDADDNSVLHVPDLGLVVAGDVIYNGVHMYLAQSATVGFGPWRDAIGKVEALGPRHIVTGHKNKELDDDAKRTIEQTRQYLDDAEELLRTENTAVGYFNAKIERYPDYLRRLILWVTAQALYGVREHTGEDPRRIILADLDKRQVAPDGAASTVSTCPGSVAVGVPVAMPVITLPGFGLFVPVIQPPSRFRRSCRPLGSRGRSRAALLAAGCGRCRR